MCFHLQLHKNRQTTGSDDAGYVVLVEPLLIETLLGKFWKQSGEFHGVVSLS
jgi:hypothetical protein